MPLDSIAENADGGKVYQPSANRGSGNSGDVDRPRWNFQTELIRQHDYHHADGTYAFTTQKGRNGSGEQVWRTIRKNMLHPKERFELEEKREEFPGIGDEDWLLYRLPELVEARQQPDPLALVVEGEKDVETARDLGFPATCNPCGALKWRHEFSEHLRGFRVAVIPDNDERGRQHADMVARSIEDAAHLVKVVELPGAQSKGDLSDWVAKRRENGESDESIKAALNELIEHAPEADPPKRKKALAPNVDNVARVMEDSPDWNPDGEALIAYDEFRDEMMLLHPVPGSRTPRSTFRHRQWSDGDDVAAQRWFNRNGFPRVAKLTVHDAAVNVAQQNIISPVKHYLEALTWDGQKRLDRWLIDHCGADVDDEEGDAPGAKAKFVSEVGRRFLISAVARAMEPGCKADACLVLEGAQGIGKSTALRILADGREQPSGHRSWFNDSLQQFVGKDAQSALRGSWIVELGELSAMKRAEVEHIKGYLSRQVDRYRPAYGRSEVEMPRRCVFAGSTNKSDYLKDETGNRRFWPVRVTTIDLKRLLEDRNQLWAEAMHAFKKGEPWHLRGDAAAYQVRAAEQRSEEDPWSTVLDCLSDVKEVATSDVLELLGKPTGDQSKQDQMRVGAMLQRAGWTTRGKFSSGPRRHSRRYVNPDPEAKKEMDREVVEEANRRGGNGPL
ncbi:virulence-associated E family protein [Roseivivax jejudonensis]|nr:virulence-associated E family protein [Roseivivax jejudonensis]